MRRSEVRTLSGPPFTENKKARLLLKVGFLISRIAHREGLKRESDRGEATHSIRRKANRISGRTLSARALVHRPQFNALHEDRLSQNALTVFFEPARVVRRGEAAPAAAV